MLRLPPDVAGSIQRILGLDDSHSLDHFSPFEFSENHALHILNHLVPNEAALSSLELIQQKLRDDQHALQRDIDLLRDELHQHQDPERMQCIQELISELLSQMARIREKATESEAVVREITKDIQVLDLAKKNITHSITALKRFQMLVNALAQLDGQIEGRNYGQISQTLSAVKEFSSIFKTYTAVERVASVWRRVQEMQGTIRSMIDEDFDAFFLHNDAKALKPSKLNDACLVVDVLGRDVRGHLIDRYCSIELKEYRRVFRANDEAGQIDNISRRFAWFRRILVNHYDEEGYAEVFPPDWRVGEHLCARFVDITRDDVTAALSRAERSLTVTVLLGALKQTLEFEQSLAKHFGIPFNKIIQYSSNREPKSISSAFDPHMGVFLDAQERALSDMMSGYRGVKSRGSLERVANPEDDSETRLTVLPSSTDLFFFYGQNLDQCATVSNKEPLYNLTALHKKWLKTYADDVLLVGLKYPDRERKSLENGVNLVEIRNACLILNTAEYCQITAIELENKIKENISEEFRRKVTFQHEQDLFVNVISQAINVLLRELESACETQFTLMGRSPWNNSQLVSSESSYMTDLVMSLKTIVDVIRNRIEKKKYFRNFLDKASNAMIAKFTTALVKSRPIKETGAEQVLLDLQSLKRVLLSLPDSQSMEGSSTYSRNVNTATTRLETLLKLVIAPTTDAESFVLNYLLLVGDSSFSNFQKILDLKGTPRMEQNHLLDVFVATLSTRDDLEPSSFLSSLDMDPSTTATSELSSKMANNTQIDSRTIFSGLTSPPLSSVPSLPVPMSPAAGEQRREILSDFKRLVNFAVRRDREQQP